ncbi:FDLD family class I lanthipeptide [Tumebacillus algifaecis]|nr:FDLD family class I lanthipeptide [Tumebacillus algifaecis]
MKYDYFDLDVQINTTSALEPDTLLPFTNTCSFKFTECE